MTYEFNNQLNSIGTEYAGMYLVNKFFIKIRTKTRKRDIPSYNYKTHDFSDDDQKKLRDENFVTLYHEYIHYIHEISTMIGITQFNFEVINRSIFSEFVNIPNTSLASEISGEKADMFNLIRKTNGALLGHTAIQLDGQIIIIIKDITLIPFKAYAPFYEKPLNIQIPQIVYEYANSQTGFYGENSVLFGKFYLYEGIAHHLEQLVARRINIEPTPSAQVLPEYKLMAQIAKFILPNIDERSMLELASLSLSYFNSGEWFIHMLQEIASEDLYIPGYIMEMKEKVSKELAERKDDLVYTLEGIKRIFKKREAISVATNHLCDQMINGFKQRILNPVFEIDITYSRGLVDLVKCIPFCDMMYELVDEDDYMKDFAGSHLQNQLAKDLQTFLCHVDYHQVSIANPESHCCPLYTFCPHKLRNAKPHQCRTKPRLSFEDQGEFGWCNYSLGIAYYTGRDK